MKLHRHSVVLALLALAAAQPALSDTARLKLSSNGHFVTEAEINGRDIKVMVDTGASAVALSHEDARRAGFRPDDLDFDVTVSTANGEVKAASVIIDRIEIGGISVEKVEGMVMPKGAMPGTLLGMSFLSRLHSFEVKDGVLHLRN
jgi:aspartyl protease family protein